MDVICYELTKMTNWNKLPSDFMNMPYPEFKKLLDMINIEAKCKEGD